ARRSGPARSSPRTPGSCPPPAASAPPTAPRPAPPLPPSSRARRGNRDAPPLTSSWVRPDLQHRPGRVLEEVVALVVDDEERGEVTHLDLPHRLHAQLGVLQDFHVGDAVLGQPG